MMDLNDTVRQLKERAVSPELQFLRKCRKYTEEMTLERINRQNKRLILLEKKGTEEALREACRLRGDMLEAAALRNLFLGIIEKAEDAQRKEKDGGERLAREKMKDWKKAISAIHANCEEIRQFQVTLPMEEGDSNGGE